MLSVFILVAFYLRSPGATRVTAVAKSRNRDFSPWGPARGARTFNQRNLLVKIRGKLQVGAVMRVDSDVDIFDAVVHVERDAFRYGVESARASPSVGSEQFEEGMQTG